MSRVLRGAIIGFGNVAANGHVPGWLARSDFEIVAVADPDPRRRDLAMQQLPRAAVFSDLQTLLDTQRLDFVDVASPPAWHADAVVAAAECGLHVLCEKPLATALGDFARMRAAALRSDVALVSVHNWKNSEAYRVVKDEIASGRIGKVERIVFDTQRDGCSATTGANWRVEAGVAGGGILVDHGWHAFYLMMGLAGELPRRVEATLEKRRFVDADVEDSVTCGIDFDTVRGEIRLTWAAPQRSTRWQVVGSGGAIDIDDDRLTLRTTGGELTTRRLSSGLSAGSHHPDWFDGVLDDFRSEIDEPKARGRSLAEAELCVRLLTQAYASARAGSNKLDLDAGVADAPERTASA